MTEPIQQIYSCHTLISLNQQINDMFMAMHFSLKFSVLFSLKTGLVSIEENFKQLQKCFLFWKHPIQKHLILTKTTFYYLESAI